MPGFGRLFAQDDRDRGYLMRRMLPKAAKIALPVRKTWRISPTALDQGNTGTCVGHAWNNFLRCAPIRTKDGPSPFKIYRTAVADDEWPGNDDEAELPDGDRGLDYGTSVRAGAEAVKTLGYLSSYVWAFSLQTAVEWVLTEGPVVLGTNWYSSFQQPGKDGIVQITPTARVEGGHAYLLRGVDTRRALARCSNSWGDEWGLSGDFLVPFRDLERLIHEQGEVCAAVERRLEAMAVMPKPTTAFAPRHAKGVKPRSGRQSRNPGRRRATRKG